MSDRLVARRASRVGRSYIYYLLKRGKKIDLETIFLYNTESFELMGADGPSITLDEDSAMKHFSSSEEEEEEEVEEEDVQSSSKRRASRDSVADRDIEGATASLSEGLKCSHPWDDKRKSGRRRVGVAAAVVRAGASDDEQPTIEHRVGKRRRESGPDEDEDQRAGNGNRDGDGNRIETDAQKFLKRRQAPVAVRPVISKSAHRALKARLTWDSARPYGRVPLSDIALFFITGALGCRLIVQALQVWHSAVHAIHALLCV